MLRYNNCKKQKDPKVLVLTTPDGGEGTTESPSEIGGAFSMGVSLLPEGGREDSPSDW